MILLALKMLIGNKASFIGIIFGIFLATLLISQQSAIFLGLVSRSYRFVTDIPAPNLWVMDAHTESNDRVRGMPAGYLDIVRGTPGIEWADPINIATVPVTTESGIFSISTLYGVDDATLMGAPQHIVEGDVQGLRREGGVIIDIYSAQDSLAKTLPDGSKAPLTVDSVLEINNKRAVVVAIAKTTQDFYPLPIVYAANSEFHKFFPTTDHRIGFIIAKTAAEASPEEVIKKIQSYPGVIALTDEQFQSRIIDSFLKTGILINFGLSVGLGLIIGFSIAGQIFYIMTVQNLMYYALIKALGGSKKMILQMISIQAALVGIIGFTLGIAVTLLWGIAIRETTLAFLFPWQLLVFTGIIVLIICLVTAAFSIRKVFHVDPKILMGN